MVSTTFPSFQGKEVFFEEGRAFYYNQGRRVYIENLESIRVFEEVFFEEGRAFFYYQGQRVYLETREWIRDAQEKLREESERRTIELCTKCGLWREWRPGVSHSGLPKAEQHDRDFFLEYHKLSCSGTMELSKSACVQSLPLEKQWRPDICPDYVSFDDAFVVHTFELGERLSGLWSYTIDWPSFIGGAADLLLFDKVGSGRYISLVGVDPDLLQFDWEVLYSGLLRLRPEHTGSGRLALFCPPDGVKFELATYAQPFGLSKDFLSLYPDPNGKPLVLTRKELKDPPESEDPLLWEPDFEEIDRKPDALVISRLNPHYLQKVIGKIDNLRLRLMGQCRLIEDVTEAYLYGTNNYLDPTLASMPRHELFENGRIMVDRLFLILEHLKLREGVRLAGLYSTGREFSGRLIGVDERSMDILDLPPLELRNREILSEGKEPVLPPWIFWDPLDCVICDNTPNSYFELSLLRKWTTELMSCWAVLASEGVVAEPDVAVFVDRRLSIPKLLRLKGDVRPLVASVTSVTAEDLLLPCSPEGKLKTGSSNFVYVAFCAVTRHWAGPSPHLSGGISEILRRREWYRECRLLWSEFEVLLKVDDSRHRYFV